MLLYSVYTPIRMYTVYECIYTCIHTHVHIYTPVYPTAREAPARRFRKGTNGVSTNGVTANFMLFDRGTFWVLPLNLRLSSQKCQGVPFSPICEKSLLLQRPL